MNDRRKHVGTRHGTLLTDERSPVLVHHADGRLPLGCHGQEVGFVRDVEDVLHRIEEKVAVRLRHAEQKADRLHRQLGRHVDQEINGRVGRFDQPPHTATQLVLQVAHRRRCQAPRDEAADAGVSGIVHHVEDDPGHREVLQNRPAVGSVAAVSEEKVTGSFSTSSTSS